MSLERDWRLARLLAAVFLLLLGLAIFVDIIFPDVIKTEYLDRLSNSMPLLRIYRASPDTHSPLSLVYLLILILGIFLIPFVCALIPRLGGRSVALIRTRRLRLSNYLGILGFSFMLFVTFYWTQFDGKNFYRTSNPLLFTFLVNFHLVVVLSFAADGWLLIRNKRIFRHGENR